MGDPRSIAMTYLLIGIGGFLGANARYLVGGLVASHTSKTFPFGTLAINVSGSFVIGLVMALITERFVAPPGFRLFFAIGFLGAYTTFSTFSFETLALLREGAYLALLANAVGSVVLGLVAAIVGAEIGRLL